MTDLLPSIDLSECFGPTAQGEGPHAGRCCYFVRFARCDLDCSWCDTPYTWRWKGLYLAAEGRPVYDPATEIKPTPLEELLVQIDPKGMVVITGGEPMLQRTGLLALVRAIHGHRGWVDIETNGRHQPSEELASLVQLFVVSPKLSSSGVPRPKAWRPEPIRAFKALAELDRAAFKFVVADEKDLAEVDTFIAHFEVQPRDVWVMPEGRTPDKLRAGAKWLAAEAVSRGLNLTGRMHVDLWGDERGH